MYKREQLASVNEYVSDYVGCNTADTAAASNLLDSVVMSLNNVATVRAIVSNPTCAVSFVTVSVILLLLMMMMMMMCIYMSVDVYVCVYVYMCVCVTAVNSVCGVHVGVARSLQ